MTQEGGRRINVQSFAFRFSRERERHVDIFDDMRV